MILDSTTSGDALPSDSVSKQSAGTRGTSNPEGQSERGRERERGNNKRAMYEVDSLHESVAVGLVLGLGPRPGAVASAASWPQDASFDGRLVASLSAPSFEALETLEAEVGHQA